MARTADVNPPTYKTNPESNQLSRTYIEQQIKRLLEVFFENSDKSMGVGKCPFCKKGDMAAVRLTDPQNLNHGGVWCNKCNFRIMI